MNRNLRQLHTEMEELESQHLLDSDGFLLYLYGVVLKQLEDKVAAKKMLARSVSIYPCCWGAWTELAALCNEDVDGSVEDMLAHLQLYVLLPRPRCCTGERRCCTACCLAG